MVIGSYLFAAHLLGLSVTNQVPGVFHGKSDIGSPSKAGKTVYDPGKSSYTLTSAGANMWGQHDEFHFVWQKVTGNQLIEANLSFLGKGNNPHRKACLIIRQSLDNDSAYADIAVHGDGLTSLQYRYEKGDQTREIQCRVKVPTSVKLERRGKYILAYADDVYTGASIPLNLEGSYYIGLGLCSHEKDIVESASFSKVSVSPVDASAVTLKSTLETVDIATENRNVVQVFDDHMEAPNWTPDGRWLVYNSGGRLYKVAPSGGVPQVIDTGFAIRCNNDHGLSPDGKTIVISDQSQDQGQSTIYTLPFVGGTPHRVTEATPSYWHGWSPDGLTLAYCAQREGRFGIFTIPVTGGIETRLTTATEAGLDDGPDYSPDGKWIYFNSDRSGKMQIYRIQTDGTGLERVTQSDRNDWFAHPSPDGKWLVYLSYEAEVKGHPANEHVMLRVRNLKDGAEKVLAKLFGGQGTINVPSWSPDSKRLAFVSYQYVD